MIPEARPEDSPINNPSNAATASGNLIKVVEAATADWLVVLDRGGNLTDLRPMFAPADDNCQDKWLLFGSYGAERLDTM